MKNRSVNNVAIIGATGIIGRTFIHMLSDNPWFRIKSLIASNSRIGKKLSDVTELNLPFKVKKEIAELKLESIDIEELKKKRIKYIFSALPAGSAKKIEKVLRKKGFYVFSNSSAFRKEADVPVLVPDVNGRDIKLIEKQGYPKKGFIVTNPNCSTAGLAVALSPLKDLGIEELTVSTYQAISGAGYPGISSMDIFDRVVPHINEEEEKIEIEIKKIIGGDPKVYATCARVPVRYGHIESVWLKTSKIPSKEKVIENWNTNVTGLKTPSLPQKQIIYSEKAQYPVNDLSFSGKPPGMQVHIGGLRIRDGKIGFNLLVNNIVRGGAGGSVLNAEFFRENYDE